MYYLAKPDDTNSNMVVSDICIPRKSENDGQAFGELYAWSLAALLDVLPNFIGDYGKCLYYDIGGYYCGYIADGDFMLTIEETKADNPVDACVTMIEKLHELNLL